MGPAEMLVGDQAISAGHGIHALHCAFTILVPSAAKSSKLFAT